MPGIIFVLLIFLLGRELVPKAGAIPPLAVPAGVLRAWNPCHGVGDLRNGVSSKCMFEFGRTSFVGEYDRNDRGGGVSGDPVRISYQEDGRPAVFPDLLKRRRREGQGKKRFIKETVFFLFLLAFLTWIMFYVFYIRDGILYSGFTVYGDYAPHTAMMRSFSRGNNFPTSIPFWRRRCKVSLYVPVSGGKS